MKKILAPAILTCALGAAAQAGEVGLLLDRQFGKDQTVQGSTGSGTIGAIQPNGVGVRLGLSLLDLKFAEIGAALTYHPKSKDDLKAISSSIPLPAGATYGSEYIALGAQVDWKTFINFHAGLDIRQEKYTTELSGASNSTTQTRPWIKAGVGFSFPLPVLSPFVRLEVAAPFTKSSKTETGDDLRKALAAQYQVALYGGVRF